MTDQFLPVRIEKTPDREILIEWSDGVSQKIKYKSLRDGCQCATCSEERLNPEPAKAGQLPVLSDAQAQPLDVVEMRPVGNYAYNIRFSDGHTTGIFTFDLLRSLP
ncbi:MAG: DUF971 domain-containing protein [Planctomycetota bacterium]